MTQALAQAFGSIANKFTRFDLLFVMLVFLWILLKSKNLLPDIENIRKFIGLANDRAGFLVLLLALSIYFFNWAMKLFFQAIAYIEAGQTTQATINMAINFVTTSAFGGAGRFPIDSHRL